MPYRATEKTEAARLADRERIVRAAQALVARGGFRSVAVLDVARRARLAVGSVYRHFPSKAELFAEVFRRASGHEVQITSQAGAARAHAAEQLAHAIDTFARRALESPTLAYALLAEPVDPAIEAERLLFRRAYRDAFAHFIEGGVSRGELPAQDAGVSASALVGAIGEALLMPLGSAPSARKRASEAALLAELQRFVRRAIGARPVYSTSTASKKEKRHDRSSRRTA